MLTKNIKFHQNICFISKDNFKGLYFLLSNWDTIECLWKRQLVVLVIHSWYLFWLKFPTKLLLLQILKTDMVSTHSICHDLNSNLPLKIGPPSFRSQVIRPPVNGPVQKLKGLIGTCKFSLQSWLWASGNTARWRIFLLIISEDAGHPMKTASPVNGTFPAGNLIEFTKSSLKSSGWFVRTYTMGNFYNCSDRSSLKI